MVGLPLPISAWPPQKDTEIKTVKILTKLNGITSFLWRGLAEIVEKYVRKGMRLYIEGRIRTRSWDDQNGNKRYTTEIWADNMQMLSYKQEGDNGGNTPRPYNAPASPATSSQPEPPMTPDDNDDLPF